MAGTQNFFTDHHATLDHILDAPLTDLRMEFHQLMNKTLTPTYQKWLQSAADDEARLNLLKKLNVEPVFSREAFSGFLDNIEEHVKRSPTSSLQRFRVERQAIERAVDTGSIAHDPKLLTAEEQLAWAAALGYVIANPQIQAKWPLENRGMALQQTQIWQDLVKSRHLSIEMMTHAEQIGKDISAIYQYADERDADNPRFQGGNPLENTRMRWGGPGSWFYFSAAEGLVNIDLIATLTGGIAHARAAIQHEIGHGRQTIKWMTPMLGTYERIQELEAITARYKAGKSEKMLTQEQYAELMSLEWYFKQQQQFFNVFEDNNVNSFAVKKSGAQDFGYSMNFFNVMLAGTGAIALKKRKGEELEVESPDGEKDKLPEDVLNALKKLQNLQHAMNLCFFQRNHLFDNTPEGWNSVGVDLELIEENPDYDKATGQTPQEALASIQELCQTIQNAQVPDLTARIGGRRLKNKLHELMDEKNVCETELWERYVDHHMQVVREYMRQKTKEKMEEQKQQQEQGDGQQQQQQGEGNGQGQGQGGGDDNSHPVEGMPGEMQGTQGIPDSPNQSSCGESKSSDSQNGKSQPQQGDDEGQEQSAGDQQPQGEEGQDQQGGSGQEQGDEGEEQQQSQGQGAGDEGEGQEQQGQNGQTQDDQGENQEQGDASGQGQTDEEGQSLQELIDQYNEEKAKQEAEARAEQEAKDAQNKPQIAQNPMSHQAGTGFDLADLPVGDWSNYREMTLKYQSPIRHVSVLLQDLIERKFEYQKEYDRQYSLTPEDNQLGRLSTDRLLRRIIKQRTGQEMSQNDFALFQEDRDVPKPALNEIYIDIDLSGSMNEGSAPNRRMDAALQIACILLEAGRKVGMDVYVRGWGEEGGGRLLASPDMRPEEIGANIDGVKNTAGWGTVLQPSLAAMNRDLSDMRDRNGNDMVGHSHSIIISDGDVNDPEKVQTYLRNTFEHVPALTVDCLVMNNNKEHNMGAAMNGIVTNQQQRINVTTVPDGKTGELQHALLKTLLQRIERTLKEPALPRFEKCEMFRQAVINTYVSPNQQQQAVSR